MTTIYSTPTSLQRLDADGRFDEALLAAAAFLARYGGRTLDAYRHDLRGFFQWSADVGLTFPNADRADVLGADGWAVRDPRRAGIMDATEGRNDVWNLERQVVGGERGPAA